MATACRSRVHPRRLASSRWSGSERSWRVSRSCASTVLVGVVARRCRSTILSTSLLATAEFLLLAVARRCGGGVCVSSVARIPTCLETIRCCVTRLVTVATDLISVRLPGLLECPVASVKSVIFCSRFRLTNRTSFHFCQNALSHADVRKRRGR